MVTVIVKCHGGFSNHLAFICDETAERATTQLLDDDTLEQMQGDASAHFAANWRDGQWQLINRLPDQRWDRSLTASRGMSALFLFIVGLLLGGVVLLVMAAELSAK